VVGLLERARFEAGVELERSGVLLVGVGAVRERVAVEVAAVGVVFGYAG
jgi:hypothetical protein